MFEANHGNNKNALNILPHSGWRFDPYFLTYQTGMLRSLVIQAKDRKRSVHFYKQFFKWIVDQDVTRMEYYTVLEELVSFYKHTHQENLIDEIYEVETSIVGDCSASLIPRFRNEPIEQDQFVEYVRALKWKNK